MELTKKTPNRLYKKEGREMTNLRRDFYVDDLYREQRYYRVVQTKCRHCMYQEFVDGRPVSRMVRTSKRYLEDTFEIRIE